MPKSVNVGLVQMSCEEDLQRNLDKAIQNVRYLSQQGAQVICLSELFRSRYFCQTEDHQFFKLAETIPGPTTEILGHLTQELGITLIASLFEKRTEGIYHNTSVTLGPSGKIIGKYRKMHIPDDPLYYEKFYFAPGDLGFQAYPTQHGKMGTLICWDQWYPEAARLTALQGAQVLFYPTAIGWLRTEPNQDIKAEPDAWETIQRSHAIANGVFVVSVNRVGIEEDLNFWGGSFVSDPFGKILAKASHNKEENLLVSVDLDLVEKTRQLWPFLRDRRIDYFQGLSQRFLDEEI